MLRSLVLGILLLLLAEWASRYFYVTNREKKVSAWTIHNVIDTNRNPRLVPLAGLANHETFLCNEASGDISYTSDKFGFNNRTWYQKPDLLLLGDSYVHGHCVKEPLQIASQLSSNGKRVLNLGLRGSGPMSQLGVLLEYGKAVRPKKIIWFILANDFLYDIDRELKVPALNAYLEGKTQNLAQKQMDVDATLEHLGASQQPNAAKEWVFSKILTGYLFSLLRPEPTRAYEQVGILKPEYIPLMASVLAKGKEYAGVPVEFVFIPDAWVYSQHEGQKVRNLLSQLKNEMAKRGMQLHDPTYLFEQTRYQNFAALDGYYGHYNEKGFLTFTQYLKSLL